LSTRLGRPKQLLEIGGKALIAHVADMALASSLGEVTVVIGYQADAIRAALGNRGVRYCFNRRYEEGQSTSLVAALNATPPTTDAVVVLLSDQPTIRSETIDRVLAQRWSSRSPIVMASYGSVLSHPILFGSELFGEIRAVEGDRGARDVIRRHKNEVATVDGGANAPPADVDTEEAYEALLASWHS
jgi:molybdenum cofactor cytidylyltransferase